MYILLMVVLPLFQAKNLAKKGGSNVEAIVRNAWKQAVDEDLRPQINQTGFNKLTGEYSKIALVGTSLFKIFHCKIT